MPSQDKDLPVQDFVAQDVGVLGAANDATRAQTKLTVSSVQDCHG